MKIRHADGQFTIVALPGSSVGDTQVIDGIEYIIVDKPHLASMIQHKTWQELSRVCTSKITHMDKLFMPRTWGNRTIPSNVDVSHWDTSNVVSMDSMFSGAESLMKYQIGNWDTSNVRTMENMFARSTFNDPSIAKWNTRRVENMKKMFKDSTFNQFIGKWNTSQVKTMAGMFEDNTYFNQALNSWDVSRVQDMSHMFSGAQSFNRHLSKWNTSNVQNMKYMFSGAQSFNKPIGNWDVSNVIHIDGMFSGALNFNQDLSQWKLKNSTLQSTMHVGGFIFRGARSFVPRGWSIPYVKMMMGKMMSKRERYPTGRNWTILHWTGEHYQNIQDFRRLKPREFNTMKDLNENAKHTVRIDDAVAQYMRNSGLKTPHKPRIFENVRYLYRGFHGEMAKKFKHTHRLQDHGFLAFSRSYHVAERYGRGGVVLRLDTWKLPDGIPWVWFHGEMCNTKPPPRGMRNTLVGTCEEEEEVVLPPGELISRSVFLPKEPHSNTHYYTIEYVPSMNSKSLSGKKIIRRVGPRKLNSTEHQTAYDRKISKMYHTIMNQK